MAVLRNIFLVIFLTCYFSSALSCSHEPCRDGKIKNQHVRRPETKSEMKPNTARGLPEKEQGDSHTLRATTTRLPARQQQNEEHFRNRPTEEFKSMRTEQKQHERKGVRGEDRNKRHVHLDLGYGLYTNGYGIGFHDYDYGYGYNHYDHHHHHGHHHHHNHHGHHHG